MNTKKTILALALVTFFFANSQEKKGNSYSLQGEYSTVSVKALAKDETFNSYYIQVSYF